MAVSKSKKSKARKRERFAKWLLKGVEASKKAMSSAKSKQAEEEKKKQELNSVEETKTDKKVLVNPTELNTVEPLENAVSKVSPEISKD